MTLDQLLATATAQISAAPHLRNMRNIEKPTLISGEKLCVPCNNEIRSTHARVLEDSEIQCSAPSAPIEAARIDASACPPLVPLESAWVEGARYRLAGAHEVANRLPLFIQDPDGDTMRSHGTLVVVMPGGPTRESFPSGASMAPQPRKWLTRPRPFSRDAAQTPFPTNAQST